MIDSKDWMAPKAMLCDAEIRAMLAGFEELARICEQLDLDENVAHHIDRECTNLRALVSARGLEGA